MPQSIWSGTISFGLVMLPVKLYPATKPRDVRFHEFDAGTGRRIRHRRVVEDEFDERVQAFDTVAGVSPATPEGADWGQPGVPDAEPAGTAWPAPDAGPSFDPTAGASGAGATPREREVAYGDVALGFEIEPGQTVLLTRDEVRALRPEQTRTVEIEEFVDLDSIDPVYFEKSYIAVPQPGSGADRAYALLVAAMERAGKVGIGRIVLRTKEHLAAIRPAGEVLLLETLFHADEVRDAAEVYRSEWRESTAEPTERELRIAEQLIGILAAEWDPARYEDRDRQRLIELIERKAGDRVIPTPEEPAAAPSNVSDLMDALKASVDAIRARERAGERAGVRRTG